MSNALNVRYQVFTRTVVSAATASLLLSGCTSLRTEGASKWRDYRNNSPVLQSADVKAFAKNQREVMEEFATLAGVKVPNEGEEWRQVIDAGIHYADVRCDRFIDALFWFNRARETTSRQIGYMGAAASAALAIVEASKDAIGLTPLGFELLDQSVNNLGNGLLFSLNPSTVRTLVEKQQEAYLEGLSSSYTSRAISFQVIQNYAALCLPSSIETQVEEAIAKQEFEPTQILTAAAPNLSDSSPDTFELSDRSGAELSTYVESDTETLTGTGRPSEIFISGGAGEYQIGGGQWISARSWIQPGASFRVRVLSAPTYETPRETTLTIGGVSDVFTVTTKAAPVEQGVVSPAPLENQNGQGDQATPEPVDAGSVPISDDQNALPAARPI